MIVTSFPDIHFNIFSISVYVFQGIPFSNVSIRKFCAEIMHLIVLCLLYIFIYARHIPFYVYKSNLTVKSTTITIIGFFMYVLFC